MDLRIQIPGLQNHKQKSITDFELSGGVSIKSSKLLPNCDAQKEHLNQYQATAIAGNDLLSSVFYTVGLSTTAANILSPLSLLSVCLFVLYPFRLIYQEIGSQINQNGSSFNCFLLLDEKLNQSHLQLNGSPTPLNSARQARPLKSAPTLPRLLAAIAAVLSIMAYLFTAIVSANSAANYVSQELGNVNVFGLTIVLLLIFTYVALRGVQESSNVALSIFVIHIISISALSIWGLYYVVFVDQFATLKQNIWVSTYEIPPEMQFAQYIAGIGAGMLGITGFESASNYIEQQGYKVYKSTLRNLWILVTIFNPLLSAITVASVPLNAITSNLDVALSVVAHTCCGLSFRSILALDAAIVLSAGILTAFVGVAGLASRMSTEGMLPELFLPLSNIYGHQKSSQNIITVFSVVIIVTFAVFNGDIHILSKLYTISFLGVLSTSISSCIMLRKLQNKAIVTAEVACAILSVTVGFATSFALNANVLMAFAAIFLCLVVVVWTSMHRSFVKYQQIESSCTDPQSWLNVSPANSIQ
ncbi:hypothetical protein MP228_009824 [Amoeboaphelidium protococcarum]|nr:hypothetical protein MP228_009824 [Amoeboaphelidium protococcarum]